MRIHLLHILEDTHIWLCDCLLYMWLAQHKAYQRHMDLHNPHFCRLVSPSNHCPCRMKMVLVLISFRSGHHLFQYIREDMYSS